jgi:rhodanese-related sulfurtransferase
VPGVAANAPRRPSSLRMAVHDASITLLVSAAIGLLVNLVRPHGIPFVQKSQYQILVPCPDGSSDAPAIAANDPAILESRTLLVDARQPAEHARLHVVGAINVPFDYLAPAAPAEVQRIASSGAARVVVFGDGGDPDSGEQLARELAGAGIRNVFFVAGGAPALATGTPTRGAP